MIHPTAIVDPSAQIATDVHIGPFCLIGPNVSIASGTRIESHVTIKQDTSIGKNNHIYQAAVLGEDCQHKLYKQQAAQLVIGDNNIIREFCTIHRGSMNGNQTTRIGSNNFIMVGCHIAHDCIIGNQVTIANQSALAGHVTIGDYATLAGYTLVHQFCQIGKHAMTGINSIVVKDIPAFVKVAGNPLKAYGLNSIGMKRHGFDQAAISKLKAAYRTVYRKNLALQQALAMLSSMANEDPLISCFIESISMSQRGIVR